MNKIFVVGYGYEGQSGYEIDSVLTDRGAAIERCAKLNEVVRDSYRVKEFNLNDTEPTVNDLTSYDYYYSTWDEYNALIAAQVADAEYRAERERVRKIAAERKSKKAALENIRDSVNKMFSQNYNELNDSFLSARSAAQAKYATRMDVIRRELTAEMEAIADNFQPHTDALDAQFNAALNEAIDAGGLTEFAAELAAERKAAE